MKIVSSNSLIIGYGISQSIYQILLFVTCYIHIIQDLFNLIFLLIILEGRIRSYGFSYRKQFWIIRDDGLEEIYMKYRMNLIIRWKLKFIYGYFGMSSNDLERSNIMIEEFYILSLSLDLDIQILDTQINRIIDPIFGIGLSILICLYDLSYLDHHISILYEYYRFVDIFEEFSDSGEFSIRIDWVRYEADRYSIQQFSGRHSSYRIH